jgi:hypothetical protein
MGTPRYRVSVTPEGAPFTLIRAMPSRLNDSDGFCSVLARGQGNRSRARHFARMQRLPRAGETIDIANGVGRALIEAVCASAKAAGASRVYWHTQENNMTACALHDKVATVRGFI